MSQGVYRVLRAVNAKAEVHFGKSIYNSFLPFITIDPTTKEIHAISELEEGYEVLSRLKYYFVGSTHYIQLTELDLKSIYEFNVLAHKHTGDGNLIVNFEKYFIKKADPRICFFNF